MNNEMDIILSRYFSGEATEEELRKLDVWLSKSDENEKQFHQLSLLYQYAGRTDDSPAVDTQKALTQFKSYMLEKQRKSNNHVFLRPAYLLRAAATVAILVITSFALYFTQSAKTIQLRAVETIEKHKLSENTDVTLFAGSKISYKKANNIVQLKGKAVFNVHSKTAGGIVVQAGETYIKDIGTIFIVDASSPDKSITVEVTEGEVWFYTEKNSGVYLKANEIAMYDLQTKQFKMIEKEVVDIKEEPISNEFDFQNTPLRDAIDAIKVRYKINIVIASNDLNEVLLNASFDKNESVEYVLDIITTSLSAKWTKKDNKYIITF